MLRWIGCLTLFVALAGNGHAQTDVVNEWRNQVAARLGSNKGSTPRGQSGSAAVGFVIDRTGKLVSNWLSESTGSPALDKHALAIVERSHPFPEPPPDIDDIQLRLTVPFVFMPYPNPHSKIPDIIDQGEAAVSAKMRSICRGC